MAAKKKVSKPRPGMLGTGGASKAGSAIQSAERRRQCIMDGGTWKNGRCVK